MAKKQKTRLKSVFTRRLIFNLLMMAFFAGIILFFILAYFAKDLPDIEDVTKNQLAPEITILDGDGEVLAKYGDYVGEPLMYSQLPIHLIQALVATEDRRFFEHSGIDYVGIMRAMVKNVWHGRLLQGGSTVTQQLAKIMFLTPERTMSRKIREFMLAIEIERRFSKEQIVSMYFNRVYLGKGNYGVDAAARFYFGKGAADLTLYESAIIVGMLKAPSRYTPSNNKELAVARARQVLLQMAEEGFVTEEEINSIRPPDIMERGIGRGALRNPYFADYILSEASEIINENQLNLNIYTTLDINAQNTLENVMAKYRDKMGEYGVGQVAGVLLDKNGAIKAMVGGTSYKESQFNRAVNAHRQAGSSFKFFVYTAAMEYGLSPNDIFEDKPISIKVGFGQPDWKPRNFSRKYLGEITLEKAFAQSINTVAVQVNEAIGRNKTIEMAHRLGIKQNIPNYPSIALGVTELSPLDMARAYAHIASDGFAVHSFGMTKISTNNNDILFEYQEPFSEKVLSDSTLEKMKVLMSAVVEEGAGRNARLERGMVYGKTGTTQDHRDSWFIGSYGNYTLCVWAGNDDDSPTNHLVGGVLPAKIFHDFFANVGEIKGTTISNESTPWMQNPFNFLEDN